MEPGTAENPDSERKAPGPGPPRPRPSRTPDLRLPAETRHAACHRVRAGPASALRQARGPRFNEAPAAESDPRVRGEHGRRRHRQAAGAAGGKDRSAWVRKRFQAPSLARRRTGLHGGSIAQACTSRPSGAHQATLSRISCRGRRRRRLAGWRAAAAVRGPPSPARRGSPSGPLQLGPAAAPVIADAVVAGSAGPDLPVMPRIRSPLVTRLV